MISWWAVIGSPRTEPIEEGSQACPPSPLPPAKVIDGLALHLLLLSLIQKGSSEAHSMNGG